MQKFYSKFDMDRERVGMATVKVWRTSALTTPIVKWAIVAVESLMQKPHYIAIKKKYEKK